MADTSPFLRLPLEIRQHIYDYAAPSLLAIEPCVPDPRTLPSTTSRAHTKSPCLSYCVLPRPCASILDASRHPRVPADPCLSLHLSCRTIHEELCQYRHCHSLPHSLQLAFCSATCMAFYTSRATALVLRRTRRVEMMVYRTGGMAEGSNGAKNILQVYSKLLVPHLRRAWRRSLAQVEEKGCNEARWDAGDLAQFANEAHMRIPVPSTTDVDAYVVVVLAAELVRSEGSKPINPDTQVDSPPRK